MATSVHLRRVEVSVREAEQTRIGKEALSGVLQHVAESGVGQLGQQLPVLEVGPLQHNTAVEEVEVEGEGVLAREVVDDSKQRMGAHVHISHTGVYTCIYSTIVMLCQ